MGLFFCDYFAIQEAAVALLRGGSPYEASYFYGPPWAVLVYVPFLYFPPLVGALAYAVLSALVTYVAVRRLGGSCCAALLFLFNPFYFLSLLQGNLEWVIVLGLSLPSRAGLLCYSVKPQLALGGFVHALKERRAVVPLLILGLGSFLLLGFWPLEVLGKLSRPLVGEWNIARLTWPWVVPLGLYLLWVWRDNVRLSLTAGLLLTPYLGVYSLGLFFLMLIHCPVLLLVLDVVLWAVVLTLGSLL